MLHQGGLNRRGLLLLVVVVVDHQDALMRAIIVPPGGVCRYYFQHLIVTNRSFIAAWNKAKTKQSRAGVKILYLSLKLNIWWF